MRNYILLFIMFLPFLLSGNSKKREIPEKYKILIDRALENADSNRGEILEVFKKTENKNREAAAFLISYMPTNDLKTLTSEFILDQINGAAKARKEFKWCKSLPDSIFLNEVLPYFSLDEERDNWRFDFYNKFKPYVKNCKTVYEAIDSVNQNIKDVLKVDYNTKRSIVNISPFKAIEEKMATCTGLSFLLVDAFRAVGIPARISGTPMWTNMRGNHNWVEVWIDGEWYFTEYYPDKLNKSWFLADAGKADPLKPIHWIYSSSYKPGNTFFMRVWANGKNDINGWNVTENYIKLYEKQLESETLKPDELIIRIVLYDSPYEEKAENRISGKVRLLQGEKQINFGFTPQPVDDLNRFLKFKIKKNERYSIEFQNSDGKTKTVALDALTQSDPLIKLYQD